MESHILSASAAYFDWKFLHVNLEDRPKIEKPVTTCFSIQKGVFHLFRSLSNILFQKLYLFVI